MGQEGVIATRAPLRRYLWNQDPRCHWCGRVTYLSERKGGKSHSLDATIDHYFSRYHKDKRSKWGNPVVLACYRCNHDRGAQETKEQPIEELWRRANQTERMLDERFKEEPVVPRD